MECRQDTGLHFLAVLAVALTIWLFLRWACCCHHRDRCRP